jgi:hypothetical protein
LSLEDLFNLFVYSQPFLWLFLYRVRMRISLSLFTAVGLGVAGALMYTGYSNGHYDNYLMTLYTLFVVASVIYYRKLGFLKPICLGFLIVFINSYYWEFPLHVLDFLTNWNVGLQLVQALHILPLPFLLCVCSGDFHYISFKEVRNLSLYLWLTTLATGIVVMTGYSQYGDLIYTIPRVMGLIFMWRFFKPVNLENYGDRDLTSAPQMGHIRR